MMDASDCHEAAKFWATLLQLSPENCTKRCSDACRIYFRGTFRGFGKQGKSRQAVNSTESPILTGLGRTSATMVLRRTAIRTSLGIVERNLYEEDAAALLETIAGGGASRCLLPWIPLMHGGAEAGIIQRWIELANQEANSRLRGDYGGLALVFAEAAKRLPVWKEALKEWNVIESQQAQEWMAMGEAKGEIKGEARGEIKGEITALLAVLATRFPPETPADLVTAIRGSTDRDQVLIWLRSAVTADSLDAFRRATGL